MAYTPLEQKLRQELLLDAGVTALVGTSIFGPQLPSGVMAAAPPVRALTVQRVSTVRGLLQERGIHSLAAVRIQFTAWAKGASSEADALGIMNAIVNFLNTFDASSSNQFGSVPIAAISPKNIVLNERITLYAQAVPPLYMGILDARIFNREDL